MKPIVVVGSSNMDLIVGTERLPVAGQTVLGGAFRMSPGGKGANQAVAAGKLGGRVYLVAKIGKDVFGENSLENFKKTGVKADFVSRDPILPSGVALICVDDTGKNIIVVAPGANGALSIADVRKAKGVIAKAACVVLQLEIPLKVVEFSVRLAHKLKIPVILNPAPARKLSAGLLKLVDIINPNETEAELITGVKLRNKDDYRKAAGILKKRGVKTVIITLGAKGVYVSSAEYAGFLPAFKVKPVDTVGAGDAFTGGLAYALSNNRGLREAVIFGNAVAAVSVTRKGAQASMPKLNEVRKLLK
ncbi:MAG: ribokinase [Candidatus Firestonebacteria bacterium]